MRDDDDKMTTDEIDDKHFGELFKRGLFKKRFDVDKSKRFTLRVIDRFVPDTTLPVTSFDFNLYGKKEREKENEPVEKVLARKMVDAGDACSMCLCNTCCRHDCNACPSCDGKIVRHCPDYENCADLDE